MIYYHHVILNDKAYIVWGYKEKILNSLQRMYFYILQLLTSIDFQLIWYALFPYKHFLNVARYTFTEEKPLNIQTHVN